MNAKNRLGAYTGWRDFAVDYSPSGSRVQVYSSESDNGYFIEAGLCDGQGHAQEVRIAQQEAERIRMANEGSSPTMDDVMAKFKAVQNAKPDPVLPHWTDRTADYAKEIAWHPAQN